MSKRNLPFIFLVMALTLVLSATRVVAQDTFMGKTAQELFPSAQSDAERDSAMAALLAANLPDGHPFGEGKTLTVAVQAAGPRGGISGPIYFWKDAFEAATGATLEIVEIPGAQLYTTTATDFLTEQHTFDVINVGSWFYGDYITNGWIQPIDEWITKDGFAKWDPNNMADPLKTLYTWEGKWYGSRFDGDAQLLYFRKDILSDPKWQDAYKKETGEDLPNPPQTWQQLLKVTTFFNGKDWNGDGDPDNGIALHLASGGQGHFHFTTLAASFAVTPATGDDPRKVTKYHNVFWFDPDDMTPLINKPGQVAALEFLQELAATGDPAQLGWQLAEAWNDFLSGNAIATFSWGDVGSLAEQPDKSTITGKLGAARIPCSDTWYDLEQQKMVTDAEHPNCVGNTTGGSWHNVMSSFTDTPDLAYYFMAFHATDAINFWEVTRGWAGTDPSSLNHLFPPRGTASVDSYVASGFNKDDAEQYITAYGENLFSMPITETYLRIPGTTSYWETLDTRLSQAMTGQSNPQDALDQVAADWEKTTNDYGRDLLLPIYQQSIGYTP